MSVYARNNKDVGKTSLDDVRLHPAAPIVLPRVRLMACLGTEGGRRR